jgi:enamine deaminase RidA (YjgF/YER057c/UK114 family)
VPAPKGDYRPAARAGSLVASAGMTPRVDGRLFVTGRLGDDLDVAAGRAAAAVAARNALAAAVATAGGADRIDSVVAVTVYIACAPEFRELSAVADGASEALAEHVRGGLPARTALGVQSLPGGAPVEVQLWAWCPA